MNQIIDKLVGCGVILDHQIDQHAGFIGKKKRLQ
jgi:hypothetical protein